MNLLNKIPKILAAHKALVSLPHNLNQCSTIKLHLVILYPNSFAILGLTHALGDSESLLHHLIALLIDTH